MYVCVEAPIMTVVSMMKGHFGLCHEVRQRLQLAVSREQLQLDWDQVLLASGFIDCAMNR